MEVTKLKIIGSWSDVLDAAKVTINKDQSEFFPTLDWRRRMLIAEHSPLRMLSVTWTWVDIPYWVAVHFRTHKVGVEHFICSQRTDRTGLDREALSQNALVKHKVIANVQAILNMARKRMCINASKETREAFFLFLEALQNVDSEIANACLPECEYRSGWCPEFRGCGRYPGVFSRRCK